VSKPLSTQNAQITTATVEIKTLTYSGRQVTKGVFAQLPEEPLVSEDATLNGNPWGKVNYHPDKCADKYEHIHVVWQRGGELLRSTVYAPAHAGLRNRNAARFIEASIAEGLRIGDDEAQRMQLSIARPERTPGRAVNDPGAYSAWCWFTWHGVQFVCELRGQFAQAFRSTTSDYLAEQSASLAGAEGSAEGVGKLLPVGAYHATWRALGDLPLLIVAG
jgi:hypothetical protein